jgi:hypothetical protein
MAVLIVFVVLWLFTYVISFVYRLRVNNKEYVSNFADFVGLGTSKYCSSDAFMFASCGTIAVLTLAPAD